MRTQRTQIVGAREAQFTAPRSGFTLVELLVVITIISILAALITGAAIAALRTARQAAIKTDVTEISGAFEKYKDKAGSYPPNAVTDDTSFASPEPTGTTTPLDEVQVLADMRAHFSKAFQRSKESDNLARVLVGSPAADTTNYPKVLDGGMTAGEATVFWLSGFSDDVSYPFSGQGGPSYEIPEFGISNNRKADPITSRSWMHQFNLDRLGPRADDGYFDETNGRFIEYRVTINGVQKYRRINFWQYTPSRSTQPVLYFDVSRNPAAVLSGSNVIGSFDPPAASERAGNPPGSMQLHVHALKMRSQSAAANVPIQFANQGKFQVLHCGIDDAWGAEILELTSAHGVEEAGGNPADPAAYLLFPTGPFTGDAADTVVNFIVPSRLEDAQQ
ncbi:MAG: prepilin-type N-terminal cleavage/methylation domain-containing protein [Pirellulales bacterium]